MLVLIDLVNDLKCFNTRELASLGETVATDANGYSVYAQLAERRMREVPVVPYKVHISHELRANPLYPLVAKVLTEIKGKLERGRSIAMYLPDYQGPKRPSSRDPMLSHWDIRHLHLSPQVTKRVNGLVVRSDFLLYFRIQNNEMYWIDIGRHKAPEEETWLRQELLNIIQHNWPQIQHLARGMAVNEPDIKTMKLGRKHNFNVFPAYRGKLIMPNSMGVMADGTPMVVSRQYMRFTDDLRFIEHNIRARPYEFGIPPHLAYAQVTLEHWDEENIFCREQRTKTMIPFHWQPT